MKVSPRTVTYQRPLDKGMKIAVIGWGSLLWNLGVLRLSSGWQTGGPHLPIEFARISSSERLTLVIHPGVPTVATFWAISSCESLSDAKENFKAREQTILRRICSITRQQEEAIPEIDESVQRWLALRPEVDAAIWTGLGSNWPDKRGRQFDMDDAISYLQDLVSRSKDHMAREYIERSPVRTPLLERIEWTLGWRQQELPRTNQAF